MAGQPGARPARHELNAGAFAALALRDRAYHFVLERGSASEEEVLAHVYGGSAPAALRSRLAEPLLADGRLERRADGRWTARVAAAEAIPEQAFTALAVAATSATVSRARLVRLFALHVAHGQIVERFDVVLNPQRRVPRYVAERAGIDPEVLDAQPDFAAVVGDLARFLGDRPILSQEAQLAWSYLSAEARLCGKVLVQPALLDVNDLGMRTLHLRSKPTLAAIAAHFGISSVRIGEVSEEARVLGLVGSRLLAEGPAPTAGALEAEAPLRRRDTASALPEQPGVYVLRGNDQEPLYVGKARRLRARMAAYVHRPLGPTRRLEGLVGSVLAVDTTQCQTDLEALVLEDREIRRLQPRFNTVRQQHAPRYWICRPPQRVSTRGRMLAPPRLELSPGPHAAEGEFVGPFRNEMLAEQARQLAREVFELDALRRTDPLAYTARLDAAWQFLHGASEAAEGLARRDVTLLRKVVAFDVAAMLLPADPRLGRYAILRPSGAAIEGFLLDQAILTSWTTLADAGEDAHGFALRLLEAAAPRTSPQDADVVLRWFGAQRPPARLIALPEDALAAADAIEDAIYALLAEA